MGRSSPKQFYRFVVPELRSSSQSKYDLRYCRNGRLSSVRLDSLAGFIAQATDYKLLPDLSELMLKVAMVRLIFKDLAA